MTNMGYCRFRNTLTDLQDCYDHMRQEPEAEEEAKARLKLIKLCLDVAADYGHEVLAEEG